MDKERAYGFYVVAATSDGKMEYWVAACPREEAVAAVASLLPPGSSAALTNRRIKPGDAYRLKLKPDSVRQMKHLKPKP
jgi:hypothetical protein